MTEEGLSDTCVVYRAVREIDQERRGVQPPRGMRLSDRACHEVVLRRLQPRVRALMEAAGLKVKR